MGLVENKTQLRCSSLFKMQGMNSNKSFVTLVSEAQVSSSIESYASSSDCVLFKGKCSRSRSDASQENNGKRSTDIRTGGQLRTCFCTKTREGDTTVWEKERRLQPFNNR